MILNNMSLVNWSMGAAIIGVFVVFCIVLVLIVLNMMNNDKKKE